MIVYSVGRRMEYIYLQAAKILQVFFALSMASIAISQSSSLAPDSNKANGAAASIFEILDRKSKIDPHNESGSKLESVKGDIELCHVSFKYPTRPDVQIFQDLSLTIDSGKVINITINLLSIFSVISFSSLKMVYI